jgi:hypothetical protein
VRKTKSVAEPVAEYPMPSEGKYVLTVEVYVPFGDALGTGGFVRDSVTTIIVGELWPMPGGHHWALPLQSRRTTPGTSPPHADAPSRRTNHDDGTEI